MRKPVLVSQGQSVLRRFLAAAALTACLVAAVADPAAAASLQRSPAVGRSTEHDPGGVRATLPGAPFVDTTVPEGLGVLVTWTPDPSSQGVTSYVLGATVATAYSRPVSASCSHPSPTTAPGDDTAALVTGLCAKVPYAMTVTAKSKAGASKGGLASNPTVPLPPQPPSQPLITSVLARSASLVVAWSAPAIGGGDALTGYHLTATATGSSVSESLSASTTTATVKGLTNGTEYAVTLAASSKAGKSAVSTSSGTPRPSYVPGSPQGLQVTPDGSGNLDVTWSAPADSGGDPITAYDLAYRPELSEKGTWTPTGSATTVKLPAATTSTTLSSLSSGDFYAVSVAAVSAAGTGQAATTSTPVSPTTQLAAGAVVLSHATMDALASDDAGTLTWDSPVPSQVSLLSAGAVLIGGTAKAVPNGLLVKVVAIAPGSSGALELDTVQASLSDAFSNVSVNAANLFAGNAEPQLRPAVAGVRIMPHLTVSHTFDLDVTLVAGAFSVEGELAITPTFSLSFEINHGFVDIPDGISMAVAASLGVTFSGTIALGYGCTDSDSDGGGDATLRGVREGGEGGSGDCENGEGDSEGSGCCKFLLATISEPPVYFDVGGVPVEVTPETPIFITSEGEVSADVSFGATIGAAISWTSAHPATLSAKNLSHLGAPTGGAEPGGEVKETATLSLEVDPNLAFYGLAGVNFEVDFSEAAFVDWTAQPFFEIETYVKIEAGFQLDFSLGPINYNQLDVTLAKINGPSFELSQPSHAELLIKPLDAQVGAPGRLQLTATASDGGTSKVFWALVDGAAGDSLSSTGLLKVVAPGGRQVRIVAYNAAGATGGTLVEVAGAGDPPADVTGTVAAGGTCLDVSWHRPASSGGVPLASYTVLTQPPTKTVTLPASATSTRICGLALGSTYVVQIYDTNADTFTSAPTGVSVTTPQRGAVGSTTTSELTLPPNAAADPDTDIAAVACPKAGYCVVVGSYDTTGKYFEGMIATMSDGGWKTIKEPLPSGASVTAGSWLEALSCASASYCVATGPYSEGDLPEQVADTLTNGVWKPTELPQPDLGAGAALRARTERPRQPRILLPDNDALSCPSVGNCVNMTSYLDTCNSSDPALLVDTESGGKWKSSTAPMPAGADCIIGIAIYAIGCSSVTFCAAAELDELNLETYMETLVGGRWTLKQMANPMTGYHGIDTYVNSVTCPKAGTCIAIGDVGEPTEAGPFPLIATFAKGTWKSSEAPLPDNATKVTFAEGYAPGRSGYLSSVTCPVASYCMAVGGYTAGSSGQQTNESLVDTLIGGHWTAAEAPLASPYTSGGLNLISCAGPGSCLLLGGSLADTVYGTRLLGGVTAVPTAFQTGFEQSGVAYAGNGQYLVVGTFENSSDAEEGFAQLVGIAGAAP
ncbi:MAG: fibronectin type III domain-containing protein [Acidimicrobiales bacterium]